MHYNVFFKCEFQGFRIPYKQILLILTVSLVRRLEVSVWKILNKAESPKAYPWLPQTSKMERF